MKWSFGVAMAVATVPPFFRWLGTVPGLGGASGEERREA
ncbi:hypothetical protein D3H35_14455 [Cohnella faecalis]|uniref:Uncharacterized protein n=1 Tax=Cohnella faecalis TaxID=2315694 RepID=A0A398CLA6_9BACL|nr:hypothetical protein D3H35_14455 [Cohnella faecalis]